MRRYKKLNLKDFIRHFCFTLLLGANSWCGAAESAGVQAIGRQDFDAAKLKVLESFIVEAMEVARVPGVAVSLIQNNRIIYEKGFGVRDLTSNEPVEPTTLFRLASATKPLTSLLIAKSVDQGLFDWNTRATHILPELLVSTPEFTSRLTMKNLLCACTGIPYDMVGTDFGRTSISAEALIFDMRNFSPSTEFGAEFQYSNEMIAVAGYAAGRAAHPELSLQNAYTTAMQNEIFAPLGMVDTGFGVPEKAGNKRASPHALSHNFVPVEIPIGTTASLIPIGPAGGVWSSVRDLSQYLLLELSEGSLPSGAHFIGKTHLLERREPQIRADSRYQYGLGIDIQEFRDSPVFGHNGGIWGFGAHMFFLPEHNFAAVILANLGPPFNVLMYSGFKRKVLELLFDEQHYTMSKLRQTIEQQRAGFERDMSAINFEPDTDWLLSVAGTYESKRYGTARIQIDNGVGIFDIGAWRSQIGKMRNPGAGDQLVLTSPPWLHVPPFNIVRSEEEVKLVFPNEPEEIVFTRKLNIE
jgi:CubicO group peptidase (beta-lactamase class C family)